MKIGNPCNWVANTHHYFLQGDLQYTNYHGVTNQVFLAYLLASGKKKFSMFRTIMFTLLPLLAAQVVEKYSYFVSGGCILFFTSNDVIFFILVVLYAICSGRSCIQYYIQNDANEYSERPLSQVFGI